MIQVRNVPDRLHRELSRRAKKRGQTLTGYIQKVLEKEVSKPSPDEVFDRIESRERVKFSKPAGEVLREERGERESRWA